MDAARADSLIDGQLAADLRAAGLRATRPRLLVLGYLRRHTGTHHSAEQVTGALAEADQALLRGSVYSVLASLVAAGLVLVADVGPGRTLYEASDRWHHHFVCRACGTVMDVSCVVGAKPCVDAGMPGAIVDEAQIIFRGLCPACTDGALDRAMPPSGRP